MCLPATILNRPVTICSTSFALLLSFTLLLSSSYFLLPNNHPLFCPLPSPPSSLLSTLLHYATSQTTPQQSHSEISLSLQTLLLRSPCNFLVFGLGHDSPMWSAFNARGTTTFLEEDPKWSQSLLRSFPNLISHNIRYPTKLSQADDLLRTYKSNPFCLPPRVFLKGNRQCPLALSDLPLEIYETEWDVIMIDAPRGYFGEAPGRMGAIFSAAVMARERRKEGVTDVFLHDVERRVEKVYGMEFLCKKYLVGGVGRLWHFRIPPAKGNESGMEGRFC